MKQKEPYLAIIYVCLLIVTKLLTLKNESLRNNEHSFYTIIYIIRTTEKPMPTSFNFWMSPDWELPFVNM